MTDRTTCPDCGVTLIDCRRYRLEALAAWMRLSFNRAATNLGISGTTLQDARCHGVTRRVADRVAVAVGAHPAEIWPEIIDHDIEDHEIECADADCKARFIPSRAGHIFCSVACKKRRAMREWRRNRYQNDPEFRDLVKAQAAAHYQAVRTYRVAQVRQYRARKKAELIDADNPGRNAA